jgi:hypothetical protein
MGIKVIDFISKAGGLTFETTGLLKLSGHELSATVNDLLLSGECQQFIEFVSAYITDGNAVQANETFAYGYWLTKAVLAEDNRLEFWEYCPEAVDFVFGVSNALLYWQTQHQICMKFSANFEPIRHDQMIAISAGVYEGDPVSAVRYQAPSHMSGWYLTTGKYDGNIASLKVVHAHHVTAKRPDLAKFFALPCGYRFHSDDGAVWYDQKAAQ